MANTINLDACVFFVVDCFNQSVYSFSAWWCLVAYVDLSVDSIKHRGSDAS